MSSVLAKAVVILEGDDKHLEDVMKRSEKRMMNMGEKLSSIGEEMSLKVTAPLVALGTLAVHEFGEQQDALAKLDAVLKATGGTAGATSEHVQELADSLANVTTFSSDATESAAAMLATFTSVRNQAGKNNDVYDQSIKMTQNLAAVMGGDMSGAAMILGKALEDPTTGLMMMRRAGVAFSAAEVEQIKNLYEHNDLLGAQKMILDGLQKKIGGVAEAMEKTPIGQMKKTWNDVKTALEGVGKIIWNIIAPALHVVDAFAKSFTGWSDTAKTIIVVIGGVVASFGPLLVTIGIMIKAWTSFSALLGTAANPVALAIIAIGLLIVAGVELVRHWTAVKLQLASFWAFIKDMFYTGTSAVIGLLADFIHFVTGLVDKLKGLPGFLGTIGNALAVPFDAADEAVHSLKDGFDRLAEGSMAKSGDAIARLTMQLEKEEKQAKKTGKALANPPAPPPPPTWSAPVLAALDDLHDALAAADVKSAALGSQFDATGAKAAAYAAAIDAIVKTHVGLNTPLDKTGDTIASLGKKLQSLQIQDVMEQMAIGMKDVERQAAAIGPAFDLAGAKAGVYANAVQTLTGLHVDLAQVLDKTGMTFGGLIQKMQQAQTIAQAQQDFKNAIDASNEQLAVLGSTYDSTTDQMNAYQAEINTLIAAHIALDTVVTDTGLTLEDLIKKLADLQEQAELAASLRETFSNALDWVVDFAYGAKQSFGDFVRSAMLDITKLILKMLALRAIKSLFGGKDIFSQAAGKILGHANGGFIAPGEIGLVGERGPELISGGKSGVMVTPLAMSSHPGAVSDAVAPMQVNVTVNAIDRKGVQDFFSENESLVAGAMMRAQQKSTALRRRLGGR